MPTAVYADGAFVGAIVWDYHDRYCAGTPRNIELGNISDGIINGTIRTIMEKHTVSGVKGVPKAITGFTAPDSIVDLRCPQSNRPVPSYIEMEFKTRRATSDKGRVMEVVMQGNVVDVSGSDLFALFLTDGFLPPESVGISSDLL